MKRILLFAIFSVATVAAVIGRLFQLLQMTDPETGFFYPKYEGTHFIVLIALAVVILALLLLARFEKRYREKPVKQSYILGISSFALGMVMLAHCIDYAASARYVTKGDWGYAILALLFMAFFVYYGICLVLDIKLNALSSMIPVLFAGYRLAFSFIKYTGIAKIPDVTLDIIMLGLCMIFWLFFGKTVGSVKYRKSVKWLYGTGLCAALMNLMCAVPKYFIMLFMPHTTVHLVSSCGYIDIAVSLYIIVFIIVDLLPRKEEKKTEDEKIVV
ncbi:MAG: hypothetical protein IJF54_01895 [Clostridia bacterium]|nr:hypothetical protein [Clostridia bacterium]